MMEAGTPATTGASGARFFLATATAQRRPRMRSLRIQE